MSSATLYVVATPIGDLQDISPRMRSVLSLAHTIFAEDTRRTLALLNHLDLRVPLQSLHAHNEYQRAERVLHLLGEGHSIALVTDAGTPSVSDPGSHVVQMAHKQGYRVSPVAGPSALTAALSVAGFSHENAAVLFIGFLPVKGKERANIFQSITAHEGIVVLYEAPHRLHETVLTLSQRQPLREICICREMTKMHEEIYRCSLEKAVEWCTQKEIKGECTLVLGPYVEQLPESIGGLLALSIEDAVKECLRAGVSVRDTATVVAVLSNSKRSDIYRLCELHKEVSDK